MASFKLKKRQLAAFFADVCGGSGYGSIGWGGVGWCSLVGWGDVVSVGVGSVDEVGKDNLRDESKSQECRAFRIDQHCTFFKRKL